jgi:hypothetical protein
VRLRWTATFLLALAAGLGGCGSDDEQDGAPIPAESARQLDERLDEIERRFQFAGGACADISADSEPAVRNILASLPSDVDPDVRDALEESFDRLFALTAEQCDEQQGQDTETEPEPDPETDVETETIPTESLPEPTEEEPPPPEEETDEELPPEGLPPGQDEELPPGQGGGGGVLSPGEDEG